MLWVAVAVAQVEQLISMVAQVAEHQEILQVVETVEAAITIRTQVQVTQVAVAVLAEY
jgi:hypothetical protein